MTLRELEQALISILVKLHASRKIDLQFAPDSDHYGEYIRTLAKTNPEVEFILNQLDFEAQKEKTK